MGGGILDGALAGSGIGSSPVFLVAVPLLFVMYVRYTIAARGLFPDLSLRTLESVELQRAVILYEQASERLKELYRECAKDGAKWQIRRKNRGNLKQRLSSECEDLESYARDLRLTIMRLKGRPFKRYKRWAHLVSAKFAFGRAFQCYLFVSVILLGVLCYFEPILWASGIEVRFKLFVLWEAVKDRLLFGNSVAANLVAVATPLLYCARRATFYSQHRLQALRLKAFAIAEPDYLIQNKQDEAESVADGPEDSVDAQKFDWASALGVLPTATIEEVKQAYKALVKKSHPDLVHDMTPAFVTLADVEMKRLNAAYAEALRHFQYRA